LLVRSCRMRQFDCTKLGFASTGNASCEPWLRQVFLKIN
jgi:hypothetical protein